MNQKNRLAVILSGFFLSVVTMGYAAAQVPVVPSPVCTSAPGIPCPDDAKVSPAINQQHPTPAPKENKIQTFNDLFQSIGNMLDGTANQIFAGLTGFFDGVKKFFQNIKF